QAVGSVAVLHPEGPNIGVIGVNRICRRHRDIDEGGCWGIRIHLRLSHGGPRGDPRREIQAPARPILVLVEPAIATAAERPDLFRRGSELTGDIWPVYNTHGEVLSVYWSRLAE